MPAGIWEVVALLSVGYLLLIAEIFVPGGIVGILGGLAIAYGCFLAFGLGTLWGLGSLGLSVAVTVGVVAVFLRSRTAKRLVLADGEPKTWKAQNVGLEELLGREGRTLTPLRPAGLAEIDGRRVDVVSDSEFLDAGIPVRVAYVEGNRVVVESVEET
jgi:membrane-bound serine protease (ClpP class)